MNRAQVWIQASRPKTLVIGISPVIIGTTLAISEGIFNPLLFLFTLLTAMSIQIGTNLANDYFDFVKGADTKDRKGFTRVTQAGLAAPEAVKRAMIAVFTVAFLSGGFLIWHGGLFIAILLALSIALGVLYTGGPYPLAYLGISEVFAFAFFGPIAVLGTYYLQMGALSWQALLAGLSPGAFSMGILIVNNVRDIDEDRVANKKTLAVRLGKIFGKCSYFFSLFLIVLPLLFFFSSHPFTSLGFLILLPAIPLIRLMAIYEDPRQLNQLFAKTGQMEWLFTFLFCIGWLL